VRLERIAPLLALIAVTGSCGAFNLQPREEDEQARRIAFEEQLLAHCRSLHYYERQCDDERQMFRELCGSVHDERQCDYVRQTFMQFMLQTPPPVGDSVECVGKGRFPAAPETRSDGAAVLRNYRCQSPGPQASQPKS
jgi:hypothetical protein